MDYTSKEMLIKAALGSVKIPYYPTLIETEQEVLRRFCHSIMDSKYSNRLANAMIRGGIKSVNDLYTTSEEQIMNIRGNRRIISRRYSKHEENFGRSGSEKE